MALMNGSQILVNQLRLEGVDTVFSLPGVQIMSAFDALYDASEDIRLVHTRHEQTTTYMADGYAKVTGKPGVAMVVPGPGALNAAAGLGTAYASSSPVLLISGQIASKYLGKRRGELHEIEDHLDVFEPITKWNFRVTRVDEIPWAVHEAMKHLNTGRPRPVELEIPPDILAAMGKPDLINPEYYPKEKGNLSDIQYASKLLSQAEKPVIIAGGGTIISNASKELLALAEFLQAPVITTNQAKGIVPEDHYLSLGANFAGLGPGYRVLPESDVILALGTRFMTDMEIKESHKIIQVNVDPDDIGKNTRYDVGITADVKHCLLQILDKLRVTGVTNESRRSEIENHKRSFVKEIRTIAPYQISIVDILQRELPEDTTIVGDITNAAYWNHLSYSVRHPRTYITSSYFGTLGYAFPTALGAKVASPDRPVVSISGDGGFIYNFQELSTAVRYGINVIALVFNNNAYGASRQDQTDNYGKRYIGTDLLNPDFIKLAESFGVIGLRTDREGLAKTLRKALGANAPVILEVQVPIMQVPSTELRSNG